MVGSISAGGPAGINTSTMDLGKMDPMIALQLLLSEKSTLFGSKITDAVKNMQDNNKKIRELTDASAALTTLKNDFKGTTTTTALNDTANGGVKWGQNLGQKDVLAMKSYDDVVGGKVSYQTTGGAAQVNQNIPAVKALVENGVITKEQGLAVLNGNATLGELAAMIEKIKSTSDSLSSDGNLLQIELNRLISLRDNTDQANSSTSKKLADTQSAIINKIN